VALRAVSDAAGEEIPEFVRLAAREGHLPTVGGVLAWLAADPRRLPVLVLLWRRSRLAARRLAQALEVVSVLKSSCLNLGAFAPWRESLATAPRRKEIKKTDCLS
jgi:hypothetical protein